ncbi:hypothetical protein BpHYR1_005340 [Brachionus plicatilis]|uniref:NADH dehydrogenase [ubiquinone] 1 beta subcomplex subunit 4 n=1 Tax=Brachionus plicatilis TaxID=10195 RepID=A0A3M7R441_BRAPC|nr:hypothetical protein BpHYR1_005340 [Brachionus plicatilis]
MSDLTTSEMRQTVAERAAARNRLKEAYQRLYNNPFRTNSQIYDPAVFRYEAARAYAREFYKITPRSLAIPAGLVVLTVWLQTHINQEKSTKHEAIQAGKSTYYDRALWSSKVLF